MPGITREGTLETPMNRKTLAVLPALIILTGDLVLKNAAAGQHRPLIPGVLSLDYTLNTGFALGLFPDTALAATILSLVILAAVFILFLRYPWNTGSLIGFGMVLGGALGNLYDRLCFGGVRDLFRLDFIHFYIFNLADVGVVAGVALIILCNLFSRKET